MCAIYVAVFRSAHTREEEALASQEGAERGPGLPNHEQLAEELLGAVRTHDPATARRFINHHPECRGLAERQQR